MLSLSRWAWACKNNRQTFPIIILLYFFLNKKLQVISQLLHKCSTRWNRIILKILSRLCLSSKPIQFLHKFLMIPRTLKPPWPLIIHFSPWCNTIQSKHDHLIRFKYINQHINIIKNIQPYFLHFFGYNLWFEYNWIILRIVYLFTFTHL